MSLESLIELERGPRYYTVPDIPSSSFPPQLLEYNQRFTKTLESIKRRHDPTVTTVAQGVLEWKASRGKSAGQPFETPREIQDWLDRFYMSRIGIRFLIGQRTLPFRSCPTSHLTTRALSKTSR